MSRRLWKTEKSSVGHKTESVTLIYITDGQWYSSGPDTEKLLLLYLANLTRGTARSPCVAERM